MLRFVDSFDHYATADILQKWSSVVGYYGGVDIDASYGRNSTQGIRAYQQTGGGSGYLTKALTSKASWVIGFAFKPAGFSVGLPFVALNDGATRQVDLRTVTTSGKLQITRNGTVLATSDLALTAGQHYFIEWKVTISNTAGVGTCVVKVNGVVWISNAETWDTYNSGNVSADTLLMGQLTGATDILYYDDLYIEDGDDATATQGAPFNDFLGDCRVKALYATADGNYAGNWTRNGTGVDADYKAVDETLQDGDTTYLSDNTTDHRSSWTFGSMGTVGTVKAVAMNCIARKDDAGTKLLDVFARRTATDYDRNKDFSLLDAYSNHQDIWGTHPDTTAWTPTIVNALEAGIRMDT